MRIRFHKTVSNLLFGHEQDISSLFSDVKEVEQVPNDYDDYDSKLTRSDSLFNTLDMK